MYRFIESQRVCQSLLPTVQGTLAYHKIAHTCTLRVRNVSQCRTHEVVLIVGHHKLLHSAEFKYLKHTKTRLKVLLLIHETFFHVLAIILLVQSRSIYPNYRILIKSHPESLATLKCVGLDGSNKSFGTQHFCINSSPALT